MRLAAVILAVVVKIGHLDAPNSRVYCAAERLSMIGLDGALAPFGSAVEHTAGSVAC